MTYKELKKILNESLINPRKVPGPIKIIIETGSIEYYQLRAIEFIREAQQEDLSLRGCQKYQELLKNAITLLGLCRLMRKEEEENDKDKEN